MSGQVTPRGAAQEQRITVNPLVGLPVIDARCGRDAEIRHRAAIAGRAQFRVGGQIADDRDNGLSGHHSPSFTSKMCMNSPFALP